MTLGGRSLDGLSRDRIANLGIARKFQVLTVFESLSFAENLRVATRRAGDAEWLAEKLAMINLTADAGAKAGALPHGKKQRLEIGMALAMPPRILLLDEPTAGLSVDETLATANLLKGLAGRVTMIVIEHDMGFVRALGARTVVLHHGHIIASGPFSAIEEDVSFAENAVLRSNSILARGNAQGGWDAVQNFGQIDPDVPDYTF